MAKERGHKAGARGHKKGFGSKVAKSSSGGPATGTNGVMPLKTRVRPTTENSTVTEGGSSNAVQQDKSSNNRKANKKGKNKAVNGGDTPADAAAGDEDLDEKAILLREIKSLGGTEEDFELLKDIESDEEMVAEPQSADNTADEKKLAKELKSFMATLGDLKAFAAPQAVTDEELEDEDEDEADEESEDEEVEQQPAHVIKDVKHDKKEESEEEEEEDDDSDDDSEEDVATTSSSLIAAASSASAPTPGPSNLPQNVAPVNKSGMLIDPHPRWYDVPLPELPELDDEEAPMPGTKEIERLQARGLKLLEELNDMFAGSLSSDDKGKGNPLNATSTLSTSDRAFIKTILTSGTETDKLSALILLSSSSPIHTTSYLNQLQGLTKKKSRDQAVRAIRAIVDWLQGGSAGTSSAGLPDRKLKWFNEQADLRRVVHAQKTGLKKNGKQPGDEQLVAWAFEDWLKKWYFSLLQVIEGLLHDPLPFVRTQMTGFIASLLSGKPEQEQNLLRLLIDKLADSDKSVSSRTSHHILQVIQSHPMMKGIVVREVAALVLKPSTVNSASNASHPIASKKGQKGKGATTGSLSHAAGLRSSDHSRYYGIITLNQIMLSRSDQDKHVANKLLETYFSVFQDLLGTYTTHEDDAEALPQHGELKDRKRRRDEKNGKGRKDEDKLKDLSRQDRRKVLRSQQALESESKLMAAVLTGVNRAFPYSDLEGDVLHARVDTLFRIIHTGTFNVGIQALTLIFQVSSRQQSVSDRFYRVLYDTLLDHRLAESSKQAMYLNLLFKAMKADTSAKRVAAFVKRLMQILAYHQPPFVCGALFLLGELFNTTPGLRSMFAEPEDHEDDLEVFKDAPESDTEKDNEEGAAAAASTKPAGHDSYKYDGRKREPQFANASNSCLWEIAPLLSHYHPSVALHASQLLYGQTITTKADLELHTLSHFLDRFVYRNAKKALPASAASIMKPGGKGLDRSGMVLMRKGASAPTISAEGPLNNEKFAKSKEEEIPVDQIFFHRYFSQKLAEEEHVREKQNKNKRKRKAGDRDDDDDSDADSEDNISIGDDAAEAADLLPDDSDIENAPENEDEAADEDDDSELDEDEIWKAMKASMPPAKGDADLMEDSGSDEEDGDDDSVAEFAYSDSEDDGKDAAMDAIFAGEDGEELDEDDGENSELGEDDMPSFFPDDDDVDDAPAFDEDEDDLIGSDEDIELGDGIKLPESATSSRKDAKNKKRKLKHLPAFASADDWKDLIDRDSE